MYALSDSLAQRLNGSAPADVDAGRALRSAIIGAAFGPLTCAYYDFSDSILPPEDMANVPWKIGMDQSVYCAFKYSAFLTAVGLLSGKSGEDVRADVGEKLWPTIRTGWRFWPAIHLITYTLVPPRHRVLWVNCADLVWVTCLSTIASGAPIPLEGQGGEASSDDSHETHDPRPEPRVVRRGLRSPRLGLGFDASVNLLSARWE